MSPTPTWNVILHVTHLQQKCWTHYWGTRGEVNTLKKYRVFSAHGACIYANILEQKKAFYT